MRSRRSRRRCRRTGTSSTSCGSASSPRSGCCDELVAAMRWPLAVPPTLALVVAVWGLVTPSAGAQPAPDPALGEELFESLCAACHGEDGLGVEDRGPSLEPEGAASADFVLRTG